MNYTPREVAKLLANRIHQPHYIEGLIRRCIAHHQSRDLTRDEHEALLKASTRSGTLIAKGKKA